jgi:BlaI family penicillinase repressor
MSGTAVSPEHRHITEAELALLQVLWDERAATTRRLAAVLYPGGGVSEYYTVQKLLERLEQKGFVLRDRSGRAHVFRAALGRSELVGRRLEELADKLCGGSFAPLLTELVRSPKLKPQDYATLVELVESLRRKSRKKKAADRSQ